ncbi:matrixin family metalloprotease [Puia sp. P3]|uniref:matrixin family metalloprotease n=1 Tax=Puia sp. P3 TaxID=3423952 RepID=UPI003D675C6B
MFFFRPGSCFWPCSRLPPPCRNPFAHAETVIIIQPFGDFTPGKAELIYRQIRRLDPNTVLRTSLPLPVTAYYSTRDRYRADSLIRYLGRSAAGDTIVIGLTNRDISTTKGNIQDWGIMGLGDNPGRAAVVSTFRLSASDRDGQLYKVAVHELGHTMGLQHCKDTTCFMRDAEGANHLDEEKDFCTDCKRHLRDKGWKL